MTCRLNTGRPTTKEELFNLRHASARNAVERVFGVLKRRFRILSIPPEYSLQVQSTIPVALAVIHNFIRRCADPLQDHHEAGPVGPPPSRLPSGANAALAVPLGEGGEGTGHGEGEFEVEDEVEGEGGGEDESEDEDEDQEGVMGENSNALRDRIALAMWNDYIHVLQQRQRDGELE